MHLLNRKEIEDLRDCSLLGLDCEICSIEEEICRANSAVILAATALELMDKLEKAKQVMHDLECCSTCINVKYYGSEPCISCINSKERTPYWEFNEKLLEVPNEN